MGWDLTPKTPSLSTSRLCQVSPLVLWPWATGWGHGCFLCTDTRHQHRKGAEKTQLTGQLDDSHGERTARTDYKREEAMGHVWGPATVQKSGPRQDRVTGGKSIHS